MRKITRKKMKKNMGIIIVISMLLGNDFFGGVPVSKAEETVVTSNEEFMEALEQKESPIVVNGTITIGTEADSAGKMLPVVIPGGTVIRGMEDSSINARCPIQLAGDDVCFQDIELTFSSSSALNSVGHREIFLAGYHLTMDNVSTYLEGADGSLGGLGGSEAELLPTIYAGGFENTSVGASASLTISNANTNTQFQGIYMAHDAGDDNKTKYSGKATLQLDCPIVAKDGIYTKGNTQAEIIVDGDGTAISPVFYGDDNTTLTLKKCTLLDTVLEQIGNVVIDEDGWLLPVTTNLKNVTVKNGGCLDYNSVTENIEVENYFGISQDSTTETKGTLVLNSLGSLSVTGEIEGVSYFQTSGRSIAGTIYHEQAYIYAGAPEEGEVNFVFPQNILDNGFELYYEQGAWTAFSLDEGEELSIGKIEIKKAPSVVNLERIRKKQEGVIPDENVYFEVVWYDEDGNPYSHEEAEYNYFYEMDYVIGIKTEYWESDLDENMEKMDWNNLVYLMSPDDQSGKYYLYALDGAVNGDYTFLFCSTYYTENLDTVADVKALKDTVLTSCRVVFSENGAVIPEATPSVTPSVIPSPTPTVVTSFMPTHEPTGKPTPTTEPTLEPTVTPILEPTAEPTLEPTVAPTTEPTVTPILEPTAKPTLEPTVAPTVAPTQTSSNSSDQSLEPMVMKPDGIRILKIKATKRGFWIKISKWKQEINGYEIQYSTKKNFKGNSTRKKYITQKVTANIKVSNKKTKKKYYVRVRTYVRVKGGEKYINKYSKWSKRKVIRMK